MPIGPEVRIGAKTRIWHPETSNIYGCNIGEGCIIGSNVVIQEGVVIGNECNIQSQTFIPKGVTIEDGVFVGPGVVFTNDKYPRAMNPDWELIPTIVRKGASIGAGARILCGVEIGEGAMIGMGTVVIHNVPAGATVVGNPAREVSQEDKK